MDVEKYPRDPETTMNGARLTGLAASWWRPALAALSVAAVIIAVAVATFRGKDDSGPISAGAQPMQTVATPATSPDTYPDTGTPSPQPTAVTVPVYYLSEVVTGGETEEIRGFRLFREFHEAAQRDNSDVVTALYEMFGDQSIDPDYWSVWPAATKVLSYQKSGDTATVDFSSAAQSANAGAEVEATSVQQLVYTVTAADNAVRKVQLLIEGKPVETLWGHIDVSDPLTRAPETDVLSHIWLLTPTEGQGVNRTFTFGGVGTAYEATILWDVRRNGTTVEEGFAHGGSGFEREPWQATVTLPPGQYVLRAWASSGAALAGLPHLDSKRITVR